MSLSLSDDQKATIAKWIDEGASVSDIQKRLKSEFQISLTYMETRFLADDLKLTFKEPEKPAPEPKPAEEEILPPEEPATGAPGKVNVTIDTITRPGSIISGRVTFSDGQTAEWYLDQMGRLGLNPATPGYRPNQQDVMAFQVELERLARSQGL